MFVDVDYILQMSEKERREYFCQRLNIPNSCRNVDFKRDFPDDNNRLLFEKGIFGSRGINIMLFNKDKLKLINFCSAILFEIVKRKYAQHGLLTAYYLSVWDLHECFLDKDSSNPQRNSAKFLSWEKLFHVKYLVLTGLGSENIGFKQKEFESYVFKLLLERLSNNCKTIIVPYLKSGELEKKYEMTLWNILSDMKMVEVSL